MSISQNNPSSHGSAKLTRRKFNPSSDRGGRAVRKVSPREQFRRFHRSIQRVGTTSALADSLRIGKFARQMFETRKDISDLSLACQVASKYADPSKEADDARTLTAMKKFFDAERRCAAVNLAFLSNAFMGDVNVTRSLAYAETFVTGLVRTVSIDEVMAAGYFTPGASVHRTRKDSAVARKLEGGKLSAYHTCASFWRKVVQSSDCLTDISVNPTAYCRLAIVPKNEKENRIIAAEGELSLYLQRGIGVALRRRLKRVGCDLCDQQNNHLAARRASLSNDLVTVDFSAASDSFSLGLVKRVCPKGLLDLLLFCRAPAILIDVLGTTRYHQLEKISSMGNGYTFELETLLFLALARAATHYCGGDVNDVTVYGDDVILPRCAFNFFSEVMTKLGFLFNKSKTMTDFHLRESCGKFYHRGRDITPFYIRGPYTTIFDKFLTLNNLMRWMTRTGNLYGAYRSLWLELLNTIPAEHRRFGIDTTSDLYIALPYEMLCEEQFQKQIGYKPHFRYNDSLCYNEVKVRVCRTKIDPHCGQLGYYRSYFNMRRQTFVQYSDGAAVVNVRSDMDWAPAVEPEAYAMSTIGFCTKWIFLRY